MFCMPELFENIFCLPLTKHYKNQKSLVNITHQMLSRYYSIYYKRDKNIMVNLK